MKTILGLISVVAMLAFATSPEHDPRLGCQTTLERLGFLDSPRPPARHVVILVDPTTVADVTLVAAQVEVVLKALADRPNSTVVVKRLGSASAEIVDVVTFTTPTPTTLGTSERQDEITAFIASAKVSLAERWAKLPALSAASPQSLIAEGITTIRAEDPNPSVEIVVMSDGREYRKAGHDVKTKLVTPSKPPKSPKTKKASKTTRQTVQLADSAMSIDCECALGSPAAFTEYLASHGLLKPSSLTGVNVHFAFMRLAPVVGRKCPVGPDHLNGLKDRWRDALRQAGAKSVSFHPGIAPIAE